MNRLIAMLESGELKALNLEVKENPKGQWFVSLTAYIPDGPDGEWWMVCGGDTTKKKTDAGRVIGDLETVVLEGIEERRRVRK